MRISLLWIVASVGCALGAKQPSATAGERQPPVTPFSRLKILSAMAGEDLLVLINKDRPNRLSADWTPKDLVAIDSQAMIPRRSGQLRKQAALALGELMEAATDEYGYDIRVRSAYRSYYRQKTVFRSKVGKYGVRKARRLSAEAGRSQHQLGTTVDLTVTQLAWKLSPRLDRTPEGRWLRKNAHRYGFVLSYPKGQEKHTGYAYEPWHYRFVGQGAAAEMRKTGLSLEEYLRRCQKQDRELRCPR